MICEAPRMGISMVLDRFFEQALAQVVSAQWEPHFHPHNYGFRPQRSTRLVVRELHANIHQGYD